MKYRRAIRRRCSEGMLLAAILALLLALCLAAYLRGLPRGRLLQPVHAVSEEALDRAEKINVNRADADELIRLPGVGKALAARIVEYREANGGFAALEELMGVSGIGEGRYKAILPHIYLE